MAVLIKRAEPRQLPPPKEVLVSNAKWPSRNVKMVLHPKGTFGGVKAPVVSLHFDWSQGGTGFGTGACYTLEEAQEMITAFSEAVESLRTL